MVTASPLRVLVVDDSAYNRKNISEILTTGSEDVEIVGKAGDGDEALKLAAQVKPDVIINAAAYTAVDRAERERDAAFETNYRAVRDLAREAKSMDALLIHFSTDYVFDGEKRSPYVETDTPSPLSVYGQSKLEGERAIAAMGGFITLRMMKQPK